MKASKIHKREERKSKMKKKPLTKEQKRSTWTFFITLFPSLILTILLTFPRTREFVMVGVLLFFYQAVILKRFIEDYYQIAP